MFMTNFDFLTEDKQFEDFANSAIAAEKVFNIDLGTSVVNCRRALEFAVKWLYSVDTSLKSPYQETLVTLINTDEFKSLVGNDIYRRISYIRTLGNIANHTPKKITKEQATYALENLFIFMDFVAYLYSEKYERGKFDKSLLAIIQQAPKDSILYQSMTMEQLKAANAPYSAALTQRRAEREPTYTNIPIDPTEAQTRKAYIDVMLTDAGWQRGKDWIDEYPIENMPNKAGEGFADYVLFSDDGRPLAVIEAKKTSVDISAGRQQAKLYADDLEKRFGRRPIIFLTNGYDTRISIDQTNGYPERRVSTIYSKKDLEKEFYKLSNRNHLEHILFNENIIDRYYQKDAVKAVCETFDKNNKRKALLVMATGSGKTRTVISLVNILIDRGWIKNFLFLADRNSLVIQAKRAFTKLLPDLTTTNLVGDKENYNARGVFSTYQTMINCIDDVKDEDGKKLYTPGHFDLIIVDEAHRSIYNKYKDIFEYFDTLLIGLTATPKKDIDKNTYEIFELEDGVPTYGYELAQAVKDKFLVNYRSIETKFKFLNEGIVYEDLSEREKAEYEEKFIEEDGALPDRIAGSALNEWVFNKDTIRQVLNTLMTMGLNVEYGNKIGKTIIFAKNHLHAEKILQIWGEEYPNYPASYCSVIDNKINYAQSLIDDFSIVNKMPQIAISVDMMDTGIDVPEVLNLVFFKKVMSKAKFWQMIGRGTRLCPGLIDGDDKKDFYIFDFCSNFEFFRTNKNGQEVKHTPTIQEQLFNLKAELIFKLQESQLQTDFLRKFREDLIADLIKKVSELNRKNFAVRQHLKHIDTFARRETYQALTYENILNIAEHIAPLINPEEVDDYIALRFDALIYAIDIACAAGQDYKRAKNDVLKKASLLYKHLSIPSIVEHKEFINTIINTDFIKKAGIEEFETVRIKLRNLIKYIQQDGGEIYDTDFKDNIEGFLNNTAELENDDLQDYKKKVNYYIRQHQDSPVILKLRTNRPLNKEDIAALENILWSEVGTKQDYEKEYGNTPLGELVRNIVGLDSQAAKEAFAKFIDDANLDTKQIYFVNQIVEYITQNGLMKDLSVLQNSPFSDRGTVADIFPDLAIWAGIKQTINTISANANYR